MIVKAPNDILTTPVKPVKTIDGKIAKLVKEMTETLEAQTDPQGVGLAAPQIGKNLSIFIIKPTPKSEVEAFINPKIITQKDAQAKRSKKKQKQPLEGCLSIPRIWGHVKRYSKVRLEYQTLTGKKLTKWFGSFKAIVIQHEVDHLNGILFTHRVLEQNHPLYEEKETKLEKLEY